MKTVFVELFCTPKSSLEFPRSLKGMNITAYTCKAVRTTFLDLFCTPKRSMENSSLHESGYVRNTNETFIVGEFAEDDFGQRFKDEVTGEQGYVDDERSSFWTWDDTECVWQSRPCKGRQMRRRKGQGKGKGKGQSKRTRQDTEWRHEEDPVWWFKRKKGKKGLSKGNGGFHEDVLLAAHGRLDHERQPRDSRSMRGIVAL